MRVLVVTNFVPDAGAPQRGRWVRDQIEEVRGRGVDVEVSVVIVTLKGKGSDPVTAGRSSRTFAA